MLPPGTRVGAYEVRALLGAGGMGEVYRAHDPRLGRDVALKVLPAAFSADRDRLARFAREARTLAALTHPHIAGIYGLEGPEGRPAIVLELVEGPTLAERLLSGPMPLADAIATGMQIAQALEAAHEKGIVHRDLKPANIKLTRDGSAKVLDFGLAKAFQVSAAPEAAQSPTVTADGTRAGTVLGTPAYMSPEQARGQTVDKRTDVWAFGCVLFEMLTGRLAFQGETSSDTIAAILSREPEWTALPASTPEAIRALLRRCLAKDRKNRLRDLGDAALELEAAVSSNAVVTDSRAGSRRRRLAGVLGILLAVVAGVIAGRGWPSPEPGVATATLRITAQLPAGTGVTVGPGYASSLALSPDGRMIVIAGSAEAGQQLYQRTLDRLEAIPLQGTTGATSPFFSPDGQWIGFFAEGHLRKVPAGGGAAVDITAVPEHTYGASWAPDDTIVLVWGARSPLYGVNARGATAQPITTLATGEVGHYHPEVLADGRTVLFDSGRWVHALDRVSKRRVKLVEGSSPRYASSGHLIFCRGTTLLAVPFDMSRLEITGSIVPLVEGIGGGNTGTKHYAISSSGSLAYLPAAARHSLVLVKADGTERLVTEERQSFENPQFSPDGQKLAVATLARGDGATDIWVHDLENGTASRLTFDGGRAPVWTPDGAAVTYSQVGGRAGIYSKRIDGSGDAQRLVALDEFHWLVGWTPDSRALVFARMEAKRAAGESPSSIWAFSNGQSRRIVGPGPLWGGRLSPDGDWIAYYRFESGTYEVYVTRFPEGGTRWLMSDSGGRDPSWSPDGTELYYRAGDRLLAARLDLKNGARVLSRRLVMQPFRPPLFDDYDIHPKDGRTLVIVRPETDVPDQVTVVVNWFEELKRLAPAR